MPTDGSSGSSASPERASSPSRWASASAPSSSTTPRRAERAGGKAGEPAPIELHPPPWYDAAMRVTTWAEYGLIVSLSLAKRAGEGPVAARELADRINQLLAGVSLADLMHDEPQVYQIAGASVGR